MKLLFDHNLSYKLVGRLADLFPDSEHVRNVNLHEADDRPVWEYARAHGFAIEIRAGDWLLELIEECASCVSRTVFSPCPFSVR